MAKTYTLTVRPSSDRVVLGDWIHEAKHWEHLITLEEN